MNKLTLKQNRFFGFFSWGFYFSTGFFCYGKIVFDEQIVPRG